jgi:hypothetical protein
MRGSTDYVMALERLWDDVSDQLLEIPDLELPEAVRSALVQSVEACQREKVAPAHPDHAAFVAAAREGYQLDGEIEIDDDATVSISEEAVGSGPSAYVQAWVYVNLESQFV